MLSVQVEENLTLNGAQVHQKIMQSLFLAKECWHHIGFHLLQAIVEFFIEKRFINYR